MTEHTRIIYMESHCHNAMYYVENSPRKSCHCDKICRWFAKIV